jgi:DNA-binding CsgD family transcriptional regulator/tetratricopeptide (TPR) repeat protein
MTAELAGTPMAAAMHRRSAEALEAIGAPAAELAGHWAAAGDRERTWAASFVAGEQAEAASAFAEAKLHFERAAEHWPPDHDGRASALLRAADAAWMTGDPRAAVELARAAQRDDAPGLESQIALAQYLWDAGERSEATKAFARAAEHLRHDSSPTARAAALWGLGRARVGEGQPDDAHRLAVAAAAVAEEAGDATWLSHAWVLAGMSRAWMGDITGVDDLERGLAAAIASGDPEAIGHAYQFLVEQLWLAGRLGEARRVGVEGIPACERVGLARSHGADTRGRTALVLLDLGEWTEADAVLEGADSRAYPAVARAMLALRRGEWTTAERELDASTSGGAIGGRGRLGGLTELARVELVWLQGDEDAARRELEAVPGQPGVWGIDIEVRRALWRSRLYRDDGQEVRHFDVSLTAAVEAERRARRDGNADAWHACVAAWAAAGRPYEQAIALLAAAETSYAARDRAGGRAHLLAGRALANGLGALPLVSHADALARRARVTLTPETRRRADPSRLTGRELEVLSLLAEGLTNPQIAQRLFLSPKTVGIHVSRILEKLDAHTRGEAVATGRRRRLLP